MFRKNHIFINVSTGIINYHKKINLFIHTSSINWFSRLNNIKTIYCCLLLVHLTSDNAVLFYFKFVSFAKLLHQKNDSK